MDLRRSQISWPWRKKREQLVKLSCQLTMFFHLRRPVFNFCRMWKHLFLNWTRNRRVIYLSLVSCPVFNKVYTRPAVEYIILPQWVTVIVITQHWFILSDRHVNINATRMGTVWSRFEKCQENSKTSSCFIGVFLIRSDFEPFSAGGTSISKPLSFPYLQAPISRPRTVRMFSMCTIPMLYLIRSRLLPFTYYLVLFRQPLFTSGATMSVIFFNFKRLIKVYKVLQTFSVKVLIYPG